MKNKSLSRCMTSELRLKVESISGLIHYIRGEKVIIDIDLAAMYEIEVKYLKRSVRRNSDRFPVDFMFTLTRKEYNSLRCSFGTLEKGKHAKFLPYAFTEQGVAMLSSILNSKKAIEVNITIMRAFVQMRKFLETHKELALKIEELERSVGVLDENVQLIFESIRQLMQKKSEPMEPIGFKIPSK